MVVGKKCKQVFGNILYYVYINDNDKDQISVSRYFNGLQIILLIIVKINVLSTYDLGGLITLQQNNILLDIETYSVTIYTNVCIVQIVKAQ